jgi:hypothetical protein
MRKLIRCCFARSLVSCVCLLVVCAPVPTVPAVHGRRWTDVTGSRSEEEDEVDGKDDGDANDDDDDKGLPLLV